MPDAIYTDPRLAALYDVLNPPAADTRFYLALAGATPRRVLDMGCGTGQLALAMAAAGHEASGADPAPAMLAVARRKPGAGAVDWIEATATGLSLARRFDLIVMTGHAFQVFLDEEAILATLRNLRRHLAPGGRLAFETRNPAAREWEDWTEAAGAETAEVEGLGRVEVRWQVTETALPLVTFETRFRFADGERLAVPSTLRFVTQPELAALLAAAGFAEVAWYGDWDGGPLRPDSREIIAVAG